MEARMHLIRTGVIFGAGWVVGARAGRERYEQVAAAASLVAERPEVRRVTEPVIAFFTGSGDGSGHRAPAQVRKAVDTVRQQATQVAGQVATKVSAVAPGAAKPARSPAPDNSGPDNSAPKSVLDADPEASSRPS
jgi:hypothetical protein